MEAMTTSLLVAWKNLYSVKDVYDVSAVQYLSCILFIIPDLVSRPTAVTSASPGYISENYIYISSPQ